MSNTTWAPETTLSARKTKESFQENFQTERTDLFYRTHLATVGGAIIE